MLELLTGTGLAAAAGLNAYIPLLALGLAARFTDLVQLPSGWSWLSNEWVLVILGVLLLIELVADKIPAVDSINDWIQTIVRPASGGLVFGSGAASTTVAVTDPGNFFASNQWVSIAIGVAIALVVHLAKMLVRPALNALSAGLAAPVVSTFEDVGSLVMTVFAIIIPVLVIVSIVGLAVAVWLIIRRARKTRRNQKSAVLPEGGTAG